ncbi:MAG: hypothetical protein ACR2P7_09010 [bacterium]
MNTHCRIAVAASLVVAAFALAGCGGFNQAVAPGASPEVPLPVEILLPPPSETLPTQ